MQAYDIFVLGLLIAAAVWGARRGLAKQLATLASLVLGYMVAMQFRQVVAPLFDITPPWNVFAAMLALFMGTSLSIWIVFQLIHSRIQKLGLGNFDTQMGALFGLAKGALIAMIVTMFAVVMLSDHQRGFVLDSVSGWNICRILNQAHAIVPSEWQQAMAPYLDTMNDHAQFAQQQPATAGSSPSDRTTNSGSRYHDSRFADQLSPPEATTESRPFQANRSDQKEQPFGAQATLLEPTFNQR